MLYRISNIYTQRLGEHKISLFAGKSMSWNFLFEVIAFSINLFRFYKHTSFYCFTETKACVAIYRLHRIFLEEDTNMRIKHRRSYDFTSADKWISRKHEVWTIAIDRCCVTLHCKYRLCKDIKHETQIADLMSEYYDCIFGKTSAWYNNKSQISNIVL